MHKILLAFREHNLPCLNPKALYQYWPGTTANVKVRKFLRRVLSANRSLETCFTFTGYFLVCISIIYTWVQIITKNFGILNGILRKYLPSKTQIYYYLKKLLPF